VGVVATRKTCAWAKKVNDDNNTVSKISFFIFMDFGLIIGLYKKSPHFKLPNIIAIFSLYVIGLVTIQLVVEDEVSVTEEDGIILISQKSLLVCTLQVSLPITYPTSSS